MKNVKLLALADLHVGNPRIDPFHFIGCIREYVIPRITSDVDYVFIAGDFFDMLLNMNSQASMIALTAISELKKACSENNVKLRVLRGTLTHDRNQPKHFETASPEYSGCVEYKDTMCVEYDAENKLSILYMPDNLPYDNIEDEVVKVLDANALKQVDVVIHHGYFKHMLPPGIPEPKGTLDYETFKKFYSGCVLNGHVHISSIYKNVLSIGSFDRMAYGEEEPKGFYEVTRDDKGVYQFSFIENKHAYPFWTVNLGRFGSDVAGAIEYFKSAWFPKIEAVKELNVPVHLRLATENHEVMDSCSQAVRDAYACVIVDKGTAAKTTQLLENVKTNLEELPEITPENLEELALPFIKKQYPNVDPQEVHTVIEGCHKR